MASTVTKPAGLPVFPLHSDPHSDCVLRRLLAAHPDRLLIPWPDGFAGGIAHRLDRPTSGAIWVADDLAELAALRRLFTNKKLTKTYRFRTHRRVSWSENRVARAIAHDRRKKKRMVVQRGASTPHRGRWYPAQTHFFRLADGLWQATMSTGVMHQIRVHAAFIGLPLAGDALYGGGESLPSYESFLLHHVGLRGGGLSTDPVPLPRWATVGELDGDRGMI